MGVVAIALSRVVKQNPNTYNFLKSIASNVKAIEAKLPNPNVMYYSSAMLASGCMLSSGLQNDNRPRVGSSVAYMPSHAIGALGGFAANLQWVSAMSKLALLSRILGGGLSVWAIGRDKTFAEQHAGKTRETWPDVARMIAYGISCALMLMRSRVKTGLMSSSITLAETIGASLIIYDGYTNNDKSTTFAGLFCLLSARYSGRVR